MDKVRRLKAEIFQALGHPTRLAIVEALQSGELAVGEILTRLDTVQANLSQHLAILRSRRLVSTRKEGNRVYYSLRDPTLGRMLAEMKRYATSHLTEDLELLQEIRRGRPQPTRLSTRRRPGRA